MMEKDNTSRDMLLYNKYIAFFNTIYDLLLKDDLEEPEQPTNKKSFRLFNNKNKSEEPYNKRLAREKIDTFINEECKFDNLLSFNSLWQFLQFVRYAEKAIFYINDPDSCALYVDSDINEVKLRLFKITTTESEIKFKLERVKDEVNDKRYSIITIHVERLHGKKMQNIFTIVDQDVDFQDISDLYLMNTLNIILYKNMMEVIRNIFDKLLEEVNKHE